MGVTKFYWTDRVGGRVFTVVARECDITGNTVSFKNRFRRKTRRTSSDQADVRVEIQRMKTFFADQDHYFYFLKVMGRCLYAFYDPRVKRQCGELQSVTSSHRSFIDW